MAPALPLDSRVEQPRKASLQAKTYRDYQVAAGTSITIALGSELSSNINRAGDPVKGRLVRAITFEGVELVPAGSTVLGTVIGADPAGKKKCGRLEFRFHVIEHPETGSRASIRTATAEFYSARPTKGNVFPELRLGKWGEVAVSLLAPLTVRLPVKSEATTSASR